MQLIRLMLKINATMYIGYLAQLLVHSKNSIMPAVSESVTFYKVSNKIKIIFMLLITYNSLAIFYFIA